MENISKSDNFILEEISYQDIFEEIQNLGARKTCQDTEVTTKNMNSDNFADFLQQIYIDINVTSVFQKRRKKH